MKKRIMCFGDSNTWGAIPGQSGRYAQDTRWTGILQQELGEDYQVIEEGYNGRTSVFEDKTEGRLSGLAYFGPCCDSQSPLDLIILMLGTNDLKLRFGASPRTIAYGLGRYLDALNITPMDGEKPQILLVPPILIDVSYKDNALFYDMFGENAVERSAGLSAAYQEFADANGLSFMDASVLGHASVKDGIHMEADSHLRLGRAFAEEVRELIG